MPAYIKEGVPLAWEEKGQGRPLVLLHPFPFSGEFWAAQREALSGSARVITPDFRGFGKSGQDGRISTMELLADDLAALLDHLELEQIVLGGLSMGGYVTLAFLRNYGRRVKALVLADTRPQADTPEGRQAREELAVLVRQQGSSAVAEQMLPRLLGQTTFRKRTELAIQVRRMIESISPMAIAAASRGMARRTESTDLLSGISCPVLVISGEEDILTTPQAADSWAKAIPNVSLVTIPAAGHLASLEQPEAFNAHLKTFLSGC